MEPHASTFGALFMLSMKQQVSAVALAQALVVAIITASVTTFATVKVLEREMSLVRETLDKHEQVEKGLGTKLDEIGLKQAGAISKAEAIHANHEQRLQSLETKRR